MNREARLFARAEAIVARKANGLYRPILDHLAWRRHGWAMLTLAGLFSQGNAKADLGSMARAGDPAWFYRRVWRGGGEEARHAAQHLAMSLFNRRDLQGYRHWLRKAARAGTAVGNEEEQVELERFETRLPFGDARAIGRGRPWRRSEKVKRRTP